MWVLNYHPKVKSDDILELAPHTVSRIENANRQRLTAEPEKYGLPLRRGLRGYRKMRIGNYRVIYKVAREEVRILMIGHRSDVYRKTVHRIA